ncbi:hypothetical protein [Tautonia marina]|uniref:hypothetical protein n=1 Tax=Tautonia marina TaxID=2653855 RepID=UPI0012603F22|nr:hypothetical protein [Tautonia marina]
MSDSQTRSGAIPLLHHPLVLPTLVVVGGWVLLLGGSFPGQAPPSSSGVHPGGSPAIENPPPAPKAQEPAPSAAVVTVLDGGSSSAPIRLMIEFPNESAAPAVITLPAPEPRTSDASESHFAPFDSQTIRTGTPVIEEPVVPPPIPGPPPDFDPTILSPLIPESVPVSPMFERDTTAEPLIARPMEELPDTFNPGPLLERYRSHEPWRSEQPATDSGAKPVAGTGGPSTIEQGDQAPEPPVISDTILGFSNAPVILPERSSDVEEPWTPAPRSTAAFALDEAGPAVTIRQPPIPQHRGLRGLFRAFRPPPPIPLVPPPPMPQGATSNALRR